MVFVSQIQYTYNYIGVRSSYHRIPTKIAPQLNFNAKEGKVGDIYICIANACYNY